MKKRKHIAREIQSKRILCVQTTTRQERRKSDSICDLSLTLLVTWAPQFVWPWLCHGP